VTFYETALDATVLHRVGEGDDIVAQLAVGEAAFWIAAASPAMKRLSPHAINGTTSRTLLVVEDPDVVIERAVRAGATETAAVSEEHGWRLGRLPWHSARSWREGRPARTGMLRNEPHPLL